jgi:hypothetical protein
MTQSSKSKKAGVRPPPIPPTKGDKKLSIGAKKK